jgi:hypothetical protein
MRAPDRGRSLRRVRNGSKGAVDETLPRPALDFPFEIGAPSRFPGSDIPSVLHNALGLSRGAHDHVRRRLHPC